MRTLYFDDERIMFANAIITDIFLYICIPTHIYIYIIIYDHLFIYIL